MSISPTRMMHIAVLEDGSSARVVAVRATAVAGATDVNAGGLVAVGAGIVVGAAAV